MHRFIALSLVLVANMVLAAPSGQPVAPRNKPSTTGAYPHHIIAADFAAILVTTVGESDVAEATGIGIYALGAPLIHVAHGRPLYAAVSVVLRVGVPIGLVHLVQGTTNPPEDRPSIAMLVAGFGSVVGAIVVDVAVLSRGEAPARSPKVTPTLHADSHGVTVGVAGAF